MQDVTLCTHAKTNICISNKSGTGTTFLSTCTQEKKRQEHNASLFSDTPSKTSTRIIFAPTCNECIDGIIKH